MIQECSYKSLLEQSNAEDWHQRVIDTMAMSSCHYYVVASCSLWEIRNIVLAKTKHAPYITSVRVIESLKSYSLV